MISNMNTISGMNNMNNMTIFKCCIGYYFARRLMLRSASNYACTYVYIYIYIHTMALIAQWLEGMDQEAEVLDSILTTSN